MPPVSSVPATSWSGPTPVRVLPAALVGMGRTAGLGWTDCRSVEGVQGTAGAVSGTTGGGNEAVTRWTVVGIPGPDCAAGTVQGCTDGADLRRPSARLARRHRSRQLHRGTDGRRRHRGTAPRARPRTARTAAARRRLAPGLGPGQLTGEAASARRRWPHRIGDPRRRVADQRSGDRIPPTPRPGTGSGTGSDTGSDTGSARGSAVTGSAVRCTGSDRGSGSQRDGDRPRDRRREVAAADSWPPASRPQGARGSVAPRSVSREATGDRSTHAERSGWAILRGSRAARWGSNWARGGQVRPRRFMRRCFGWASEEPVGSGCPGWREGPGDPRRTPGQAGSMRVSHWVGCRLWCWVRGRELDLLLWRLRRLGRCGSRRPAGPGLHATGLHSAGRGRRAAGCRPRRGEGRPLHGCGPSQPLDAAAGCVRDDIVPERLEETGVLVGGQTAAELVEMPRRLVVARGALKRRQRPPSSPTAGLAAEAPGTCSRRPSARWCAATATALQITRAGRERRFAPISSTKRCRSGCSRSRISSSDQWKW